MKYVLFGLLFISIAFSCQSEQEKMINAEFSKIQGHWSIESYSYSSVIANDIGISAAKRLRTGELMFNNCKYSDKAFAVPGRSCGGNFDINGYIYGLSYNYNSGKYMLSLSVPYGADNKPVNNSFDKPIIDLVYGEWTIETFDNKLKATQIKGYNDYNTLLSFTAIRK